MPKKKIADKEEQPKKKATSKKNTTKARTTTKTKAQPTKEKVAKPKIKIKKIKAKAKLDDSVVNLKGDPAKEIYEEGEDLTDDEEIEAIEELKDEEMDFDWDELLEADSDREKLKKISKLKAKQNKRQEKKEKKTKTISKLLPFLKKQDQSSGVEKLDRKLEKIKKKKEKKEDKKELAIEKDLPVADHHKGLPMNIYRKLAVSFVILAVVLIAVIAYFALVKATVIIKLKDEVVDKTITASIYDRGEDYIIPEDAVRGLIKEIEIEQSKVYDVVGSEVIGEEVTGVVTIINNYVKNQPLVATTRLLSPEGQLFRLKNSVVVPAGKSITAEVYADQPSEDMVVGDTHFIIPGLWEGLQDKIYAESKAGDITFKKKLKKVVKQEEIDAALADIRETLIEKAKLDIDQTYDNYNQKLYQINEEALEYEVDAEVGDEVDQFVVTMKATITVVAFADGPIFEIVQSKLRSELDDNRQLLGLRPDEFTYKLLSVDLERDIAEIEVAFRAKFAYRDEAAIVNKEEMINLSRSELVDYLKNQPEIDTFDIQIRPSFVNKTPSLVDRIKIEIAK